ncbi:hypothetical protein IMG5_077930 [Ichthyophthirius multifiliis]|uniref:Transmembrane protein n=1 Tax=Ichthyophthirius multifiliis TaxID=5932 RepID=G0QQE7_ICHMU|nr:hypothetical protein IMG5_077930 [Ichthyophthirius multifiliis]EGR32556.1 hypothetical protein IMG5_077930 [Ichthyophthirius multifiliis]|eukprot:XP_004036542.1 hypothetical protein IMG5_077930 [Ichthyophthirius multifiliis]
MQKYKDILGGQQLLANKNKKLKMAQKKSNILLILSVIIHTPYQMKKKYKNIILKWLIKNIKKIKIISNLQKSPTKQTKENTHMTIGKQVLQYKNQTRKMLLIIALVHLILIIQVLQAILNLQNFLKFWKIYLNKKQQAINNNQNPKWVK